MRFRKADHAALAAGEITAADARRAGRLSPRGRAFPVG